MTGEEIDVLIAKLEAFKGKTVKMTLDSVGDSAGGFQPDSMAGVLESVRIDVWCTLDYGYGMNALGDGFRIREVE